MTELNAWIAKNYGALALLALVLLAAGIALLVLLLLREKRAAQLSARALDQAEAALDAAETLLRRTEENARTALSREEFLRQSELLSQRQAQAMAERGRDEALRLEALSQRLDAFGTAQETRLHRIQEKLDEKLSQNEERIERMRATLEQSVGRLQEDNGTKLEEMRQTVDEKLHATLDKRLGESFALVNQRLEQVHKGLGEMQALANGVGDLKKVLTNVKTRGVWGEMQLGTLLNQMLAPSQYDENVAVVPGSAQRVEFAVKLPGQGEGTVYLPIDSKFPIEDYERLLAAQEAGDAAQIAAASAALQTALKIEAKRIASKYLAPPHTTDFDIMFLPLEGLYAEALRARGLCEELQEKYRIAVAGPTTLNALLTSLQVGFRTLAIEKRSGEVWQLLGAVKTEFGNFAKILEATQKKMHAVAESIESASRKSRTIERKLRQVEGLEAGDAARLLGAPEEGTEEPME